MPRSNTANGSAPRVSAKRHILIVDDHPLFRRGLADLLNHEDDLEAHDQAGSYRDASAAIKRKHFDVVILDLGLGEAKDGLELIRSIKLEQTGLAMLVITVRDEALYAGRCLRAGARGYVMKHESLVCVIDALRSIFDGKVYLSPAMTKQLVANHLHGSSKANEGVDLLTNRELEIFHLIGHGISYRKIASSLDRSAKTVEAHRENIKKKLNLNTTLQLVRFATSFLEAQG